MEALASVTGGMVSPFMEMEKTIGGTGFVKEDQGLSFGHIRLEMLTTEEIIPFTRDKSYKIPMN